MLRTGVSRVRGSRLLRHRSDVDFFVLATRRVPAFIGPIRLAIRWPVAVHRVRGTCSIRVLWRFFLRGRIVMPLICTLFLGGVSEPLVVAYDSVGAVAAVLRLLALCDHVRFAIVRGDNVLAERGGVGVALRALLVGLDLDGAVVGLLKTRM